MHLVMASQKVGAYAGHMQAPGVPIWLPGHLPAPVPPVALPDVPAPPVPVVVPALPVAVPAVPVAVPAMPVGPGVVAGSVVPLQAASDEPTRTPVAPAT